MVLESDDGMGFVIVLPISIEIQYAAEYDYIAVGNDKLPFNFAFMVEVWNETSVVPSAMAMRVGTLRLTVRLQLLALWRMYIAGESAGWNKVGPQIMDPQDGRIQFQGEEVEAFRPLAEEVTAMIFEEENNESN
jgi:hypothetical protein